MSKPQDALSILRAPPCRALRPVGAVMMAAGLSLLLAGCAATGDRGSFAGPYAGVTGGGSGGTIPGTTGP